MTSKTVISHLPKLTRARITEEEAEQIRSFAVDSGSSWICPFCDGGQSKEKSFGVEVIDDGILYNCLRASCGRKGKLYHTTSDFLLDGRYRWEKKRAKLLNPFPPGFELVYPLPTKIQEKLVKNYQLTQEDMAYERAFYCQPKGWLVMSAHDIKGRKWGKVSKCMEGVPSGAPKTVLWREAESVVLHFPRRFDRSVKTIVLVEDWLSATKCSTIYPGVVALLGSSLTYDQATHLRQQGYKNIVFMLDADTWASMETPVHKARANWGWMFASIEGVFLEKDPKDMDYHELEAHLQF